MLFGGIDWSDKTLDFHLRTADGEVLTEGQVTPNVEGLAELFTALEAHGVPAEIGIAIETAHGAWVQALLDRGYQIYPVNPKTVESFRKALSVAGNKSDKIDRKVLAMFLATFHQDLRVLRPDDPEIVSLRIACEDRVRLVEERKDKTNQLQSILKAYYPAFLGLFGRIQSRITLKFLQEFPTQNQMLVLSRRRLRSWLRRHRYTKADRVDDMVDVLERPVLPVADHLQAAKAPLIRYLACSLMALNAEIAERERQITQQFDALPEANWARSLPGAARSLAPALVACLGRDPQRFPTTADAQAFMGTAPVTKASGNSRVVHFRRGCWKFARRTLQLFANQSRRLCPWAQAFYEDQRAAGHGHQAALRALAHKWLKIILAMRRTNTPYNEALFINSRRRYLLKTPLLTNVTSYALTRSLT
jgi:transposase